MSLNVPYFYQFPGEKHLFDGNGKKYANIFDETAADGLKLAFSNRSKEKMDFDCEIIFKNLNVRKV